MSASKKAFPLISIALITAVFVGAYYVLRSLPDAQCGFLHYEEIVHPDGTVEFCATNHAGFLDLTRLKYPLQMKVEAMDSVRRGQTVGVELTLETLGGTAIAPHELAITHTKPMHVMLIDSSMEDYHHVHPQADGLNGRYTFEFNPQRTGRYRVFTEIVPVRTRRQLIATGELAVDGHSVDPSFESNIVSIVDGIKFSLGQVPEQLRVGRDYKFDLQVSTEDGSPVELEMIMGAKGHMVAFDEAGRGFAHMHPVSSIVGGELQSDDLGFLFNVPNPGWYRVFAQVLIEGREVFGHFDLHVE